MALAYCSIKQRLAAQEAYRISAELQRVARDLATRLSTDLRMSPLTLATRPLLGLPSVASSLGLNRAGSSGRSLLASSNNEELGASTMPLKLNGYTAHVCSDGKELEAHGLQAEGENAVSCWIASESGKVCGPWLSNVSPCI